MAFLPPETKALFWDSPFGQGELIYSYYKNCSCCLLIREEKVMEQMVVKKSVTAIYSNLFFLYHVISS